MSVAWDFVMFVPSSDFGLVAVVDRSPGSFAAGHALDAHSRRRMPNDMTGKASFRTFRDAMHYEPHRPI
jgi:hypothetical protein